MVERSPTTGNDEPAANHLNQHHCGCLDGVNAQVLDRHRCCLPACLRSRRCLRRFPADSAVSGCPGDRPAERPGRSGGRRPGRGRRAKCRAKARANCMPCRTCFPACYSARTPNLGSRSRRLFLPSSASGTVAVSPPIRGRRHRRFAGSRCGSSLRRGRSSSVHLPVTFGERRRCLHLSFPRPSSGASHVSADRRVAELQTGPRVTTSACGP